MSLDNLLHEDRRFPPGAGSMDAAKLIELSAAAEADPVAWWMEQARAELQWVVPFTEGLDDSKAPFYRWFADGTLNASSNCLDRHLPERADRVAIRWEGEDGAR
jgi:acetyl-CoA synthetase